MEQKLPKRSEVAVEQTWKLEDVYPDLQAFEDDLKRGLALADEIAGYEGKLGDGAEVLLKVYELYQECKKTDYRFVGYAMMRSDVDTGNADNLALLQRAQSADVQILEKTAFIEPEVLALGEDKINAYYESCPALRAFKITIDDAIRLAPHTLNKSEEKLLAGANIMALAPYQSFSMLQNADMKFPTVKTATRTYRLQTADLRCSRLLRTASSARKSLNSTTEPIRVSATPLLRSTMRR